MIDNILFGEMFEAKINTSTLKLFFMLILRKNCPCV